MSNFNNRQIERIRTTVLARDGSLCKFCKKLLANSPNVAEVIHLDGNVNNNPVDYSNYGLAHKECNQYQFKHRIELPVSDRPMTPEMERREILRPLFLKEVNHRINENHSCCLGEALYDVSMVIGASVQFARDTIKQEIGTNGVWGIGQGKCKSPLCKRKHVYLKDEIPKDE